MRLRRCPGRTRRRSGRVPQHQGRGQELAPHIGMFAAQLAQHELSRARADLLGRLVDRGELRLAADRPRAVVETDHADVAGDGAAGLDTIYAWLHSELIRVNVGRDAVATRECLGIVTTLAQTWRDAALAAASVA